MCKQADEIVNHLLSECGKWRKESLKDVITGSEKRFIADKEQACMQLCRIEEAGVTWWF